MMYNSKVLKQRIEGPGRHKRSGEGILVYGQRKELSAKQTGSELRMLNHIQLTLEVLAWNMFIKFSHLQQVQARFNFSPKALHVHNLFS